MSEANKEGLVGSKRWKSWRRQRQELPYLAKNRTRCQTPVGVGNGDGYIYLSLLRCCQISAGCMEAPAASSSSHSCPCCWGYQHWGLSWPVPLHVLSNLHDAMHFYWWQICAKCIAAWSGGSHGSFQPGQKLQCGSNCNQLSVLVMLWWWWMLLVMVLETREGDRHGGQDAGMAHSHLQQQIDIAVSPESVPCEDFLQGSQFSVCVADLFICNVFNMINVEGFSNWSRQAWSACNFS